MAFEETPEISTHSKKFMETPKSILYCCVRWADCWMAKIDVDFCMVSSMDLFNLFRHSEDYHRNSKEFLMVRPYSIVHTGSSSS